MNDEERQSGEWRGEMRNISLLQGVSPGRYIHGVTVLDLRETAAEEIARIVEIDNVTVIVLANENRSQLNPAKMNNVGTIVIAAPSERVLVMPQLDLSRATLEAMPDAQRWLVVGNLFIKPDVPPALVVEKFATLRLVGILIACERVYGALLGQLHAINGLTLLLPEDATPFLAREETTLTSDYLNELPDDTTLINIGDLMVDEAVPVDLLRQKVRAYYNAGDTSGSAALLAVLQGRCRSNQGEFEAR